ncbi:MAG: hypothetical protein H6671_01955 [Anaerolineaceae bacterium]|nr:hypothetical protein [Anaerolineaceae bacterium]
MNAKRYLTSLVLIGLLALGVTAASAQDTATTDQPGVLRQIVEIVATETGLEPAEIVAQVREGSTAADIITANGGDVEAVKAELVSVLTERINTAVANGRIIQERADTLLSNLDNLVNRALNGELRPVNNPNRPNLANRTRATAVAGRDLIQAVAEETGLNQVNILRQARNGVTLATIITDNGGSVDNVIAAAVTSATGQINAALAEGKLTQAQADALLERLEATMTDAVNGELERPIVRQTAQQILGTAAVRQVADAAGMDFQSVVTELQSGKSVATILGEHGVDVNIFIENAVNAAAERLNEQVAAGRLSQELVDQRLEALRTRLTDLANRTFPADAGE